MYKENNAKSIVSTLLNICSLNLLRNAFICNSCFYTLFRDCHLDLGSNLNI